MLSFNFGALISLRIQLDLDENHNIILWHTNFQIFFINNHFLIKSINVLRLFKILYFMRFY